jgi:hypothetical protein
MAANRCDGVALPDTLITKTSFIGRRLMTRPAPTISQDRVTVRVAGAVVSAAAIRHDPGSFHEQLATARVRFHSALCNCQDRPLQLVIRHRQNKLFLACWPGQAQDHALDCPFYSAASDSASSHYTPGAIVEDGETTTLRLHHPLVKHKAPDSGARRTTGASGPDKLHLWGILHHLWESGGLNRWRPGWHRDWGLVRAMLRRAAQSTIVDQAPLLLSLYVPPIWMSTRSEQISRQWHEFLEPLKRQHRGSDVVASGLVIGVVRKLEVTQFGYSIRLRNHSTAFFVDKMIADRMASYSRRGWSAIRMMDNHQSADEGPLVVAALRVQVSKAGSLVVVEGALMRVSKRFIPVNSSFEELLADKLVQEDRCFIKPLHYDIHSSQLAHFVLTDCAHDRPDNTSPRKVALFAYGASIDPLRRCRLEDADRAIATAMGCDFWMWNAAQSLAIPALPKAISQTPQTPPCASS